jgi:6-phosphogluconolactonase (cycloisomerase 2 family)
MMDKKIFAFAGNWNFIPGSKGISVFRYDVVDGTLEPVETVFSDVAAGQQFLDRERGVLYITNEIDSKHGEKGGGGYVIAFRIDRETGKLSLINEKESLSSCPCYICLDGAKLYALVAHHGGSSYVTKIIRDAGGAYFSKVLFDDTALVLFRVNRDGSLGEICDASIIPGEGLDGPHVFPHLHSVVADPSGKLFIVCDKGMDKIYTCHLDYERSKMIPLGEIAVETGIAPRYGAFHPKLPYFYVNFERKTVLHSYKYDPRIGILNQVSAVPLLTEEEEKDASGIESSDILIHPSGRYMYAAVRGVDRIVILDLDDQGGLIGRGHVYCGGKHPRGLCLSPDGRFLFCANMESGLITSFSVRDDGSLEKTGETKAPCPANMSIAVF